LYPGATMGRPGHIFIRHEFKTISVPKMSKSITQPEQDRKVAHRQGVVTRIRVCMEEVINSLSFRVE